MLTRPLSHGLPGTYPLAGGPAAGRPDVGAGWAWTPTSAGRSASWAWPTAPGSRSPGRCPTPPWQGGARPRRAHRVAARARCGAPLDHHPAVARRRQQHPARLPPPRRGPRHRRPDHGAARRAAGRRPPPRAGIDHGAPDKADHRPRPRRIDRARRRSAARSGPFCSSTGRRGGRSGRCRLDASCTKGDRRHRRAAGSGTGGPRRRCDRPAPPRAASCSSTGPRSRRGTRGRRWPPDWRPCAGERARYGTFPNLTVRQNLTMGSSRVTSAGAASTPGPSAARFGGGSQISGSSPGAPTHRSPACPARQPAEGARRPGSAPVAEALVLDDPTAGIDVGREQAAPDHRGNTTGHGRPPGLDRQRRARPPL